MDPVNESTVIILAIGLINEGPVKLRPAQKETQEYQSLVQSIRAQGFLGSITVNQHKDDSGKDVYEVIDGCQRLNAAKDAGLTEIPCAVLKNVAKIDILYKQVAMNANRVDTKPAEYAAQLKRIMGLNPTMTLGELGLKLGVTASFIQARLNLLKLDEGIQKLVDEGKVTLVNASALTSLDVNEQKNYIQQAMTSDAAEFIPLIGNRKKELAQAKKAGGEAKPQVFEATYWMRKPTEFKEALAKPEALLAKAQEAGATTPLDFVVFVLQWGGNSDPVEIAARKAKYEAKIEEAKKAKEARAAEAAAKKEKAAAAAAAALANPA